MIYITGDCHSYFYRFQNYIFSEQKEMTKDDYVIICGDFGGIWYPEKSMYKKAEDVELDWLDSLPFTTLFVDGNHENFDRLYNYPIKEWHGGKVHEIRPSVLHLMRGEIFDICGKRFFTFGGASCHDIRDGVLDPETDRELINEWNNDCTKQFRIKGISWWEQELPSEEEMQNGINNLEKVENKVDYVITHCAPASTVALIGRGLYEQDRLTKYLEKIRQKIDYSKWFCGHYHINKQINEKDIVLYEQIIRIC